MKAPIRVLLIEEDPEDAAVIEHLLGRAGQGAFEARRASRLAQGCKLLSTGIFDVVLLDLALPGGVGIEAFLKVHEQAPQAPVIAVAALKDEALAVEAVGLGAQDHLLKGLFDERELARVIRGAIERAALVRQWESLLENDEAGKLVLDAQGLVRYASGAARALLGRTTAELLGKAPPCGLSRQAPSGQEPATVCGAGQRLLEARFSALRWGGASARLLCLRDVTERRQIARTEAAGLEREADAGRGAELVLGLAQELAEPLSTARAALAQLRRGEAGPLGSRQAGYLELAEDAARRQARILEDARDLARLESGRLKAALRPLDLAPLIGRCLEARGSAGPRFEREVASCLPRVSADPELLARLLARLFERASGGAKQRVLVRAAQAAPGRGTGVVVSVIDDGQGWAKAGSLDTGLDLAVCREIVSRHGGELWVESAPGRGSRFHFSLPRSVEA